MCVVPAWNEVRAIAGVVADVDRWCVFRPLLFLAPRIRG
jgi:hypothetical protein